MHQSRRTFTLSLSVAFAAALTFAACSKAPSQEIATGETLQALTMDAGRPGVTETTSVAVPPSARDTEKATACPEGMTLVEGEYCPDVEQTCLEWIDPPGDRYAHFRCARYKRPAVCKGPRLHERFCIDSTERTEAGSDLPMNRKSWTDASRVCAADGARLCMTSEWQFACEGEEMRPYPYGWERDSGACNVDVMTGLGKVGRLVDHRAPASAHPRCVSAFGVHDMAGNVDEWATVDGAPRGSREVMKGSWWLPGRHACRSFQGGHGANYGGTESGVRCCKEANAGGDEISAAR